MGRRIKLPHYTHYLSGSSLGLGWLITISVNDYVAARHLDWHRHDELEIIFPVHGRYQYEFRSQPQVEVDNNVFLVVPKGMRHRLSEAIDSPGLRFSFHLKKPSGRFATRGIFSAPEYNRLYNVLSKPAQRAMPASPIMKSMIATLSKIINRNNTEISDDDRLRARLLCCHMLGEAALALPERASESSTDQTFAQAIRWLEQNHASDISLTRLVEHIGYSRARFFSLFKQQFRTTPCEYLRDIRIKKAKELLSTTQLSAAQIGMATGLGDPAHFSRLFKKMTGFTPIAYRKQKLLSHRREENVTCRTSRQRR